MLRHMRQRKNAARARCDVRCGTGGGNTNGSSYSLVTHASQHPIVFCYTHIYCFIRALCELCTTVKNPISDLPGTPQLHVGRAHALNGQERHASAQNDALMALRQILRHAREGGEDPGGGTAAAEAYSVLGRSLYYARDYAGSAEALEESARLWEEGGLRPSVFDAAHLEECRGALAAGLGGGAARGEAGAPGGGGGGVPDDGASLGGGKSVASHAMSVVTCVKEGKSLSNIPKLKPPRFVSREKVRCSRRRRARRAMRQPSAGRWVHGLRHNAHDVSGWSRGVGVGLCMRSDKRAGRQVTVKCVECRARDWASFSGVARTVLRGAQACSLAPTSDLFLG